MMRCRAKRCAARAVLTGRGKHGRRLRLDPCQVLLCAGRSRAFARVHATVSFNLRQSVATT